MNSLTPEAIDKIEHDFLTMLDALEELANNSPEKITPELKESYIGFYACLEEFYIKQACYLYKALKKL